MYNVYINRVMYKVYIRRIGLFIFGSKLSSLLLMKYFFFKGGFAGSLVLKQGGYLEGGRKLRCQSPFSSYFFSLHKKREMMFDFWDSWMAYLRFLTTSTATAIMITIATVPTAIDTIAERSRAF